jgi:helicase
MASRDSFFTVVRRWLAGDSYLEIAGASRNDLNEILAIYTGAISYGLQSVVDQGISLLEKFLELQGRALSPAVRAFPDRLRFGVPTDAACALSTFDVSYLWIAPSIITVL